VGFHRFEQFQLASVRLHGGEKKKKKLMLLCMSKLLFVVFGNGPLHDRFCMHVQKEQLKSFLPFYFGGFFLGLCASIGYQGSILFLFLFSENCANAPTTW
jgi:hypothetical protein